MILKVKENETYVSFPRFGAFEIVFQGKVKNF